MSHVRLKQPHFIFIMKMIQLHLGYAAKQFHLHSISRKLLNFIHVFVHFYKNSTLNAGHPG